MALQEVLDLVSSYVASQQEQYTAVGLVVAAITPAQMDPSVLESSSLGFLPISYLREDSLWNLETCNITHIRTTAECHVDGLCDHLR